MAKHPAVSSAKWFNVFNDELVSIDQDLNDDIFFKVVLKGDKKKTKYFYNETVWSDVPRYCADELGLQYWSVLD